ncbi:hypothetical protein J0895_01615 [Phormidium pseudopriestleyi FRX01]|uniref:Uncharacterized protein n=1 Tax=Phormidium pseudopriestleyi FRX01 TaxID=1759528 RepID=A0ABS3FL41_9CYAN|nr:hypothetical protein [Phormidium pseudopriestleyi]MBO0347826.1 hypothetical protein [Phormidium pseudopriestleyi FRX01]
MTPRSDPDLIILRQCLHSSLRRFSGDRKNIFFAVKFYTVYQTYPS